VVYKLDGVEKHTATEAPFSFKLDTAPLAVGNHIVQAMAVDQRGRAGQAQVTFSVLPPPKSSPINGKTIMVLLAVLAMAGLGYFILRKKQSRIQGVVGRLGPFARRSEEPVLVPIDGWPTPTESPKPLPPPVDRPLGRVVVMDEEAIRGGRLDAIEEYELRSQPLTLGSSPSCDIHLPDSQGRIAAEEARLWVQRGRLVYHKLTTLSAMATEGVTSGWEFLQSGEELRLGTYRIVFEEYAPERVIEPEPAPEPQPKADEAQRPLQEHGMSLSDLWTRAVEETNRLRQSTD
jgi:hypothetical protein